MEAHLQNASAASQVGHHVLGKSIMKDTHQGDLRSFWPLGLNRPPLDWGTTTHGKLGADQFETICTKSSFLVVIVRRWGYPDPQDDAATTTRKRRMLHNYADLVKASCMIHNRITSSAHCASCDAHMLRFFGECSTLYRNFAMRPSNHIGLHYGDVMRKFGPSHAIKVPGFERLNYVLSSINTNQKHGERNAHNFGLPEANIAYERRNGGDVSATPLRSAGTCWAYTFVTSIGPVSRRTSASSNQRAVYKRDGGLAKL